MCINHFDLILFSWVFDMYWFDIALKKAKGVKKYMICDWFFKKIENLGNIKTFLAKKVHVVSWMMTIKFRLTLLCIGLFPKVRKKFSISCSPCNTFCRNWGIKLIHIVIHNSNHHYIGKVMTFFMRKQSSFKCAIYQTFLSCNSWINFWNSIDSFLLFCFQLFIHS